MSSAEFSNTLMASINELDEQQEKLFEKHLKQWLEKKYQFNDAGQETKYNGVPLTSAQQRLYAMCATEQGFLANLVCQKITLTGALDTEQLVKAILLVTERHPAFKTVFKTEQDGSVLQWIDNRIVHEVERCDFSGDTDATAALVKLEQSHSAQIFDLESGPVFRFTLARMGDDSHSLFFTTHNLVFDAWSYDVVIRELKHFYNASVRDDNPGSDDSSGEKSTLPRNRYDFLDYVCWSDQWKNARRYQKQMDYWQQALDFAHSDDLTLDFPRSEQGRSYGGKRIEFTLPIALKERLNEISKSNGATLFMTSLAAITAFFAHSMAMRNICIGTISANRPRPEIENIVGYFLNLTPINTQVDAGVDNLLTILAKVKETSLKAIENTDVYSESLANSSATVSETGAAFDPLRNPFFDVLFSFETLSNDAGQENASGFSGITEAYEDLDKGTARYDLTLSLYDDDNSFYGWLEYNTALFKDKTAKEITRQFTAWLATIAEQPEQVLQSLR